MGDGIRLGYGEGASWFIVVGVAPKIYYGEPGEESSSPVEALRHERETYES